MKSMKILALILAFLPVLLSAGPLDASGSDVTFFDFKNDQGRVLPFELVIIQTPSGDFAVINNALTGTEICGASPLSFPSLFTAEFTCSLGRGTAIITLANIQGVFLWEVEFPNGDVIAGSLCLQRG